MKRLALALLAAAVLAGCAAVPTVYQPAAGPQGVGFSEYRIEADRYRVTFRGGPGAPPEQVADYALLRAADLTLDRGYDWFRVVERDLRQAGPDSRPRMSIGTGGADFGRHSAVGVGIGTSFNLGGGGPPLAQTLEILLGKGAAPRGADVYDAREVRKSAGARI
ncbi:CC0125/CC1285 family lipoprotein [Phenylobacterium sp.]|jgi:hypothetical protein|uniref:CC0125/CC1285 family lipoprotein n=1 Tax=Phenylobacterium sp. TaxID=1871053 RepID=UPI002F3F04E6